MNESGFATALAQLRQQLSALAAQLDQSDAQLNKAKDEITHARHEHFNPVLRGEFVRTRGVA